MATRGLILFIIAIFQFQGSLSLRGLSMGIVVAKHQTIHGNLTSYVVGGGGSSGIGSRPAGTGGSGDGSGSGSGSSSPDGGKGASNIPVYAAGSRDNHPNGNHHSGGHQNHSLTGASASALGLVITLSLFINLHRFI